MLENPIRLTFEYFDADKVSWERLSRDYWTQDAFDKFVLEHAPLDIDPKQYESLSPLERINYVARQMAERQLSVACAMQEARSQTKQ